MKTNKENYYFDNSIDNNINDSIDYDTIKIINNKMNHIKEELNEVKEITENVKNNGVIPGYLKQNEKYFTLHETQGGVKNCIQIFEILVDCKISQKKWELIEKEIKYLFITHEDLDHINFNILIDCLLYKKIIISNNTLEILKEKIINDSIKTKICKELVLHSIEKRINIISFDLNIKEIKSLNIETFFYNYNIKIGGFAHGNTISSCININIVEKDIEADNYMYNNLRKNINVVVLTDISQNFFDNNIQFVKEFLYSVNNKENIFILAERNHESNVGNQYVLNNRHLNNKSSNYNLLKGFTNNIFYIHGGSNLLEENIYYNLYKANELKVNHLTSKNKYLSKLLNFKTVIEA